VSDGNAANRNVHVHFENPSGTVYTFTATSLQQAASKTVDYSFIAGVGANLSVTDLHAVSPLPPPFLRPTDIIRIAVTNIQATDQLSRIFLVLERYPTDGPPYIDTAPGR
jgi:hypothetical protein